MSTLVPALPAQPRIGVIGLGYVGLPLALAFARHHPVVGYDHDRQRIAELQAGIDLTGELDADQRQRLATLACSAEPSVLAECNVFLVAVPTPVNRHKVPDLAPLMQASQMLAPLLKRGDVVVYESTVYPGCTEEVCIPLLEAGSRLRCNQHFSVGYSPERINPGDRRHRLDAIVKLTSASNPAAAAFLDRLYGEAIAAGTWPTPDIRTAEAAKAVENIQRDVNIALMNEFAQIFHRLGLDTEAVLAAAGSKWNFLPFRPGLVGGHCIGVDPYYLIHKAQEAGHHPELITAARRINDGMAGYVCARLLRRMALEKIPVAGARLLLMGVTFKEDCPDLRNSQSALMIEELRRLHFEIDVLDPWVPPQLCERTLGLRPLEREPTAAAYDAILLAVAHSQFRALSAASLRSWLKPGGIVFDLKHVLPAVAAEERL